MNELAIYHWWDSESDPLPYQNLRSPILLSIATLRSVSDIPIVVLVSKDSKCYWKDYCNILNFETQTINFHLEKNKDLVKGYRHLSRIFDLHNYTKNSYKNTNILYVDSDVFFLNNPIPFCKKTDGFCYDGWNTGYFYYNTSSENYNKFFEIFDAYTKSAIHSSFLRKFFQGYVGYHDWYEVWDEMILGYMKIHHPNLFNLIPIEEHGVCRTLHYANVDNIKMFHANGSIVSNPINGEQHARGLICLMINEFYNNINKILNKDQLIEIYGEDLINYYKNKKFSLLDNIKNLKYIKTQTGHYDLNRIIHLRNLTL